MPGTLPDQEILSRIKYQMVMIIILPCNGQWVNGISQSFAVNCQYLSSIVRDLRLSLSPHGGRRSRGFPHLDEKKNI